MRLLRFPDGGDAVLDLREPGAQRLGVLPLREQREVGEADQERVRHRARLLDEGERSAPGGLSSGGCGVEDAARLRPSGNLGHLDQAALLQLGEHVVDRGEPDVRPLPDTAALDHLFQVVAMLRAFDEQTENGQFSRSQFHIGILVLEY